MSENIEAGQTSNYGTDNSYQIDISSCQMNDAVLGVSLYDNYKKGTEFEETTVVQIADMLFTYNMSYNDFVNEVQKSSFYCSGYSGDSEVLLRPDHGFVLTVSIEGQEVFEASLFNMTEDTIKFQDCTLTKISIVEGTTCKWYNSYGIGPYGENVPDYFTFKELLDENQINYEERTVDDGNLWIYLGKMKDAPYYKVCSFVFDKYDGKCIYTGWDKGDALIPTRGTVDY